MMKFYRLSKILASNIIRAIIDTVQHDGIEHSGYLAFLLMLGVCPFLVFLVALLGNIGSNLDQTVVTALTSMILESSWAQFIDILRPRIIEIASAPPQSLLTLAILSAIWTASSIFEALRTILNRAYRVFNQPAYLLRRLWSIIEFIIVITLIILVMLFMIVLPSLWNLASELFIDYFPRIQQVHWISMIEAETTKLRYCIILGSSFMFISYLYYFLPNRKHKLSHTFPGTVAVLAGWTLFSMLFKYYITSFPQINLIYGSIAGIIIALLYFYACSLILIYGAELNYNLEKSVFSRRNLSSKP